MCAYVNHVSEPFMCAGGHGSQKVLYLKAWATLNLSTWVLGTELQFSREVSNVLPHWAITLADKDF